MNIYINNPGNGLVALLSVAVQQAGKLHNLYYVSYMSLDSMKKTSREAANGLALGQFSNPVQPCVRI